MGDKDRSKFLLSKDALPKVVVPETSEHPVRQFRMPSALKSGPVEQPAEAASSATPAETAATGAAPAAKESPSPPSAAPPRKSKPAKGSAAADAVEGKAGHDRPTGKGKRADSTMRFRDRTLDWFRTGDDLAERPESEEYESEEPLKGSRAIFVVAAIALLALVFGVVAWALS